MATISGYQARRVQIYSAMMPLLQQLLPQVRELLERQVTGDLMATFRLGHLVRHLIEHQERYGADPVEQLGRLLGIKPRWFYNTSVLAQTFTAAQIKAFDQAPLPEGKAVTLEHLNVLAMIKAEPRRQVWIERLLAEGLTARQLRHRAEAAGDLKLYRRPPRPRKPGSPLAGATSILVEMARLQTLLGFWKQAVLDEVDMMPVTELDPVLLAKLAAARQDVAAAAAGLGVLQERLAGNLARAQRVLALRDQRARGQATPEPTRPPARDQPSGASRDP